MILWYLIVLMGLVVVYWNHKMCTYWSKKRIPFVPAENLMSLAGVRSFLLTYKLISKVYNSIRGPECVGFFRFRTPVLLIKSPSMVNAILNKDFKYFYGKRSSDCVNEKDPLTQHLLALSGPKWKQLRTKLSPAFTSKKIKTMIPLLQECIDEFLSTVDKSDSQPIDVRDVCIRFSADVIMSVAFGVNLNSLNDPDNKMLAMGKSAFKSSLWDMVKADFRIMYPNAFKLLRFRGFDASTTNYFHSFVSNSIQERIRNKTQRPDLLQQLIELKSSQNIQNQSELEITDLLITAQAFSFFIGGFETTSTTICTGLFEIAKNTDVLKTLQTEVDLWVEKHGKITYESLAELPYLHQVVSEVLRLYPSVFVIPRLCAENYLYDSPTSKLFIEKDTQIVIPVVDIHRDPTFYTNPLEFNPERFKKSNLHNIPAGAYIPFGDGPRECIGQWFAMVELKLMLAAIIQNYHLELNSNLTSPLEQEEYARVFKVKEPVMIRFKKRVTAN